MPPCESSSSFLSRGPCWEEDLGDIHARAGERAMCGKEKLEEDPAHAKETQVIVLPNGKKEVHEAAEREEGGCAVKAS